MYRDKSGFVRTDSGFQYYSALFLAHNSLRVNIVLIFRPHFASVLLGECQCVTSFDADKLPVETFVYVTVYLTSHFACSLSLQGHDFVRALSSFD